jgi:hypothetical protein
MFVLINIIVATLLDDRFVPRADFSLKAFAERSFGVFQESPVRVAWKFSPRAAPDARTYVFHPYQTVTDLPMAACSSSSPPAAFAKCAGISLPGAGRSKSCGPSGLSP